MQYKARHEALGYADELIERLNRAGSTGLDLSPGDPLCAEAAGYIASLLLILNSYRNRIKELAEEIDDYKWPR